MAGICDEDLVLVEREDGDGIGKGELVQDFFDWLNWHGK